MEQSLAGNQRELDLVERELQQMEVCFISAHLFSVMFNHDYHIVKVVIYNVCTYMYVSSLFLGFKGWNVHTAILHNIQCNDFYLPTTFNHLNKFTHSH